MKNIKKILIPIVVVVVLGLAVFGIISTGNSSNTTPTFTIEEQKQFIAKDLQVNEDYNDTFLQNEYRKYKEVYINNYNKIKNEKLEDVVDVIEFKQLSPITKVSSCDAFKDSLFLRIIGE